jgi:hypothetical protein
MDDATDPAHEVPGPYRIRLYSASSGHSADLD